MDNYQNNDNKCPYCNQTMPRDLLSDHIMCHEIESQENNIQNDINPNPNSNPNLNQNNDYNYDSQYSQYGPSQNQNLIHRGPPMYAYPNDYSENNNNNNYEDNNNNNYESNNYYGPLRDNDHIQRGPPRYMNPGNDPNINNNIYNRNNRGNYNPIIDCQPNQNQNNNQPQYININNRSNYNNYHNGYQPQSNESIYERVTNSIASAFTGLRDIGAEMLNRGASILSGVNNNQPNYIRNNNNHGAGPVIGVPPIHVGGNGNGNPQVIRYDNQHPRVIVMPPIVIGGRGQVLDVNHQGYEINYLSDNNVANNNNNNISEDELNRIMEYLPSSVVEEKKEGEGDKKECVICLGEFDPGESLTTLPCVHIFHTDCIKSWLQSHNHCPVCKYEITLNSIMREQ